MIPCPQCAGSGEVEMSDGLIDVLRVVKERAKGISCGVTASEVYLHCADRKWIKVTAVNNRLTDLEKLGHVRREKRGKEFLWFPVMQQPRKDMHKIITKLENGRVRQ